MGSSSTKINGIITEKRIFLVLTNFQRTQYPVYVVHFTVWTFTFNYDPTLLKALRFTTVHYGKGINNENEFLKSTSRILFLFGLGSRSKDLGATIY
jgi:hypothetical protein